eukprot:m.575992 g.575992  ORF g.575992 m.575992 type:complete len:189 (+) comp57898_c0_seq1:2662-3228(+)
MRSLHGLSILFLTAACGCLRRDAASIGTNGLSSRGGTNPRLEGYFPFDPYSLPVLSVHSFQALAPWSSFFFSCHQASAQYVAELYLVWQDDGSGEDGDEDTDLVDPDVSESIQGSQDDFLTEFNSGTSVEQGFAGSLGMSPASGLMHRVQRHGSQQPQFEGFIGSPLSPLSAPGLAFQTGARAVFPSF